MSKKTKITAFVLPPRNDQLFDGWSVVHTFAGIGLSLTVGPFPALLLMVLWEPLEIFVLSRFLVKRGIVFGHETLRNSMSDIIFDCVGVTIGAAIRML